jgi:hypothetical protein
MYCDVASAEVGLNPDNKSQSKIQFIFDQYEPKQNVINNF